MEDLEKKLEQIKIDMQLLEESNKLLKRQASILSCFDRIYKEVL